jgi:hypothetical protein
MSESTESIRERSECATEVIAESKYRKQLAMYAAQ